MDWQNIIITVASAALTALASWVVTKVTTLINTKVKSGKAQTFLNTALSVVTSVVKATYQTYVESIKGTDAWTEDAQAEELSKAVESAKMQLSTEVQTYINQTHGSIENWLKTQIEAEIYTLKKEK